MREVLIDIRARHIDVVARSKCSRESAYASRLFPNEVIWRITGWKPAEPGRLTIGHVHEIPTKVHGRIMHHRRGHL